MATFTSTSGSYTTTLTVTETGTSTANNTSTVEFSLTLTKNSGTGLWNNNYCPWSININGTSYSGSFTYDFRNYSSLTLKSTTSQTVAHANDGTKSISVSASVDMDNTPYVYTMSPSGTLTLTTIPRASDVSFGNHAITSTSGNLGFTVTSKADFWHRYRYTLNGTTSSWINIGEINNTSWVEKIANTTLLAGMPTSVSASITIEVATMTANYATYIGSKSASATVTINTSYIKPTVSLGNISISSSPISNYAVAGYSKVQSAWSTSNSYGASSVTTYFTVSTGSLATTSSTSTSGTVVSNTIPSNANNYTLTIYAYSKDSRGAVSATVSKAVTVYGYQPPTANLTAYRTTDSTSTNEDGAGTYAYVTFSGAIRSSVNSQNTVQSITCTYSGSISGTATSGGHYALADTQSVTFKLTVTDKVTSSIASVSISMASYPLDLYDSGTGIVGAGFGTIAKAGQANFGVPLASENGNFQIILSGVTASDIIAVDSSITTSSADSDWFSALLKTICVKYPNKTNTLFYGSFIPNSIRYYSVLIYDTSVVSSTTGLPQYSFGMRHALATSTNQLRFFGTHSYVFQYDALDFASRATTATSAGYTTDAVCKMITISDTSVNTLNTSTFVSWLNAHDSEFQASGTTLVKADARYTGYATVIVNKVGDAYGRAIIVSYYNDVLTARLTNGTWTEGKYIQSISQDTFVGSRDIYINSSSPFVIELSTYGGAILKGFCQGVGGVLIGIIKQGSTLSARNLMSGTAWSNSYLTITLSNNVLTIATPNTSSNSRFTFEYTCD